MEKIEITNRGTISEPLTSFDYTLFSQNGDYYYMPDGAEVYLNASLEGNGLQLTAPYRSDTVRLGVPAYITATASTSPETLECSITKDTEHDIAIRIQSTSSTMSYGSISIRFIFRGSTSLISPAMEVYEYHIYFIPTISGEGSDYPSPATQREEISPQAQRLGDEIILMSDPSRTIDLLIYSNKTQYNCVESYSWISGSEQPFEYVTLTISKKQLSVLAPMLSDRIIAGRNIITIIGPGQGTYVVTSCKKNSTTWSVTAYSAAEQVKALKTSRFFDLTEVANSPSHVLFEIATEGFSRISSSSAIAEPLQAIVYLYDSRKDKWEEESAGWTTRPMTITSGTSIWYIMSLCALKLGCKIWVANNNLYVIDPTLSFSDTSEYIMRSTGMQTIEIDKVYLNREGYFPLSATNAQNILLSNVLNLPKPGKEGIEVLRNKIYVEIDASRDYRTTLSGTDVIADGMPGAGSSKGTIESDPISTEPDGVRVDPPLVAGSIEFFREISFTYHLPQLGYNNAKAIANLAAEQYCDSETSISFEVREMVEEEYTDEEDRKTYTRKWEPLFGQLTRIHEIVDYSNDLHISTACNFDEETILNSKGLLSYVKRRFPEHTAEYTFGISTPTDLSQSTSIVNNAINNG